MQNEEDNSSENIINVNVYNDFDYFENLPLAIRKSDNIIQRIDQRIV